MGNLAKLMDAGIIAPGAALNDDDQKVINSLTDQEVAALISIKGKLTQDFIQRNLAGGGGAGVRGVQTIGIVF